MKLQWVKTNRLIKTLFSDYVWEIPNKTNAVYLTFDDGPTPEITPWVLDILKRNQVKATFFCIGDNIRKYPEIFQQILSEGHSIGNHTYNHIQGWKSETEKYLDNISLCEIEIQKHSGTTLEEKNCGLFRPPYGKIKRCQAKKVLKAGYRIIMWDILTVDYDKTISPEKCLRNATEKVSSGSVIVFHDSVKAFQNVAFALPETIRILKEKGFNFEPIR